MKAYGFGLLNKNYSFRIYLKYMLHVGINKVEAIKTTAFVFSQNIRKEYRFSYWSVNLGLKWDEISCTFKNLEGQQYNQSTTLNSSLPEYNFLYELSIVTN